MARRSGGIRVYLWGGLGLIAAAIVAGYVAHGRYAEIAAARDTLDANAARGPVVQVVNVSTSPAVRNIQLLGDARAFSSATLFSKVSGYLKSIAVDKGDKVKAGDKLAEISSAETDALYDAAVADLDNKRRLAARDKDLLTRGNVAVQAAQTSDTNLRMAEQAVRNLATMKGYETITAPFDGIVTARFADPGALVQSAATAQSSALPIVTLSDNSKLRITAYVEQRDVPYVHVGDPVDITDAADRSRVGVDQDRPHRRRARSQDAHTADRDGCRQQPELPGARLLRLRHLAPKGPDNAADPGRRADRARQRQFRRHRRRERRGVVPEGANWRQRRRECQYCGRRENRR